MSQTAPKETSQQTKQTQQTTQTQQPKSTNPEYITDKQKREEIFTTEKSKLINNVHKLVSQTGINAFLMLVSEDGQITAYATPALQPLVTESRGKNLILECLDKHEQKEEEIQENTKPESPTIDDETVTEMWDDHQREAYQEVEKRIEKEQVGVDMWNEMQEDVKQREREMKELEQQLRLFELRRQEREKTLKEEEEKKTQEKKQ